MTVYHVYWVVVVVVVSSQLNGTSTPKGSYSAKTGDNDTIRYQAKSEQNVRQDRIPRVRHGEAALMHPTVYRVCLYNKFPCIGKRLNPY